MVPSKWEEILGRPCKHRKLPWLFSLASHIHVIAYTPFVVRLTTVVITRIPEIPELRQVRGNWRHV